MTARGRFFSAGETVAVAFSLCLALASSPARAADADTVAMARAAYDRGAHAYDAGKYALAAREFTVADELAPNPVALKFALQAAIKIDDPVLGMRLVERATQEGAELGGVLREARDKFTRRAGRITLTCPNAPCRARIDGEPTKTTTWVTPGPHAIEWEPSGRGSIVVAAGESIEVSPPPGVVAPPVSPPSPGATPAPETRHENSSSGGGLSPTWFWVGIGITTIGVVGAIASGADTLHKHQLFAAHPTLASQEDGQAAQLRTNVIFGVTAALAVVTTAIGVFAVKWTDSQKARTYLDLHIHGPGLALSVRH